jgi:hypothetical protein
MLPLGSGRPMTRRDWEKLYRAAVMETDWSRIEEHIYFPSKNL